MDVLIMLIMLSGSMARDGGGDMVPLSCMSGGRAVPTRAEHAHEWIEGPRGGMYYFTPWGSKVYRRKGR